MAYLLSLRADLFLYLENSKGEVSTLLYYSRTCEYAQPPVQGAPTPPPPPARSEGYMVYTSGERLKGGSPVGQSLSSRKK